ncbi:hypothetical protein H310_05329 [Aphanomyces invadans]|uniref:Uncharacterized protein n=1 Tax=Aphanomyces invadans TaxID=157072 RepID=A0A024UAF3_9STRA|nr:hypothetical protein H310_05329 [Aphanomyces invadans]ETW02852.1 hypothetical protein H310_05329 [Aphanomyces invadans]|eukprot:XP_008868236.1 hypothetical protein H310_05329 [Aphanomyces invadans]
MADEVQLTQVNNDLPFKHAKSTAKAWDSVAAKLLQAPSFARYGLDGKEASSHFFHLLRVHRKFQETSKYLSGVAQDETGKIVRLDELLRLHDEHTEQRQAERTTATAAASEKEEKASHIRVQAMRRGRRSSVEPDDSTDSDAQKQINTNVRYKRSFNDASKQTEKPHELSEIGSMTLLKQHFDLMA